MQGHLSSKTPLHVEQAFKIASTERERGEGAEQVLRCALGFLGFLLGWLSGSVPHNARICNFAYHVCISLPALHCLGCASSTSTRWQSYKLPVVAVVVVARCCLLFADPVVQQPPRGVKIVCKPTTFTNTRSSSGGSSGSHAHVKVPTRVASILCLCLFVAW